MKANPVLVWVTLSTFLLVVIATDQIILPNNLVASCYEDGQEWLLSTKLVNHHLADRATRALTLHSPVKNTLTKLSWSTGLRN